MYKSRRGSFVGGLIAGVLACGLTYAVGAVSKYANAQEKSEEKAPPRISLPGSGPAAAGDRLPPSVSVPDPSLGRLPPLSATGTPGVAAPAPKGITDLLAELTAIRAKKEELAKAEKATLAAIRAKLKQQKEELAQLEKKLTELGIEPQEQPLPKSDVFKPDARETAPAAGLDVGLPPLPPVDGSGKSRQ